MENVCSNESLRDEGVFYEVYMYVHIFKIKLHQNNDSHRCELETVGKKERELRFAKEGV